MLKSFLKILEGGRPDEIVWTADLDYWVSGQRQAGTLDERHQGEEGLLRLARELGTMPYYWYEEFWLAAPAYDGIDAKEQKDGNETVRIWKTPVGQLKEVSVWVEESCSQACVRYPVQNEDDLKTLLYILEHRRLRPACLENYDQRRRLWEKVDGIPFIAMPRSPLSALAVEWCGMQNLVYLMMDYPDLVRRILELFEEQERPIVDAVCEIAPRLVHFADNLTSEFYTPFFDEFMAGPYRRRLERLHSAGVKCAVHLDGTVRGLLGRLAEVGFDAIEALTPAPVGDVDIMEMRELAGSDKVVLWGGVPGAMFAPPFEWPDMERHVTRLLDLWSGTRFVVGVADQVPPNGDIEMCRKISELIRNRQGQ